MTFEQIKGLPGRINKELTMLKGTGDLAQCKDQAQVVQVIMTRLKLPQGRGIEGFIEKAVDSESLVYVRTA